MIQVLYRINIKMTDKTVITRDFVTEDTLLKVLDQLLNLLKLSRQWFYPNQCL
ncbi:hypothetical protein C4J91_4525 [Pseudomonas sp. R3-52-08]|nr:hypothetical protein C4J91_4525 [Pseudomonas sp. R3-52-08]